MTKIFYFVVGLTFFVCHIVVASESGRWCAESAGAQGDGLFDNTPVLQKLLDEAGQAGGGIVCLPAGRFCVRGNLVIPAGVTLEGTFRVPPNMNTINEPVTGTILQAYAGRGRPDEAGFIRLAGDNSCVRGLIIVYPEQDQQTLPPVAYPPTIESSQTSNVGVIDCCLLNSYEGIRFIFAARHLVRNVTGYPIKRGLFVDQCYDIGHIENIHFWPFGLVYKPEDPYCKWINVNGVAFEFARTDWHYVSNTFCFGYGVGYKFSDKGSGATNGNFLGIGADSCRRAVLVEGAQAPGLLITNGEFVGRWTSTDSICLEVPRESSGVVSLNNCAFWGPVTTMIRVDAPKAQVTVNACNFVNWDNAGQGQPALAINAGKIIVQGCTFQQSGIHALVGKETRSAIFSGNQAEGGFNVLGNLKHVLCSANEPSPFASPEAIEHYRIRLGTSIDAACLVNWYGREEENALPYRWSSGSSGLLLPVALHKPYTVELACDIPTAIAEAEAPCLYLNDAPLAVVDRNATTVVFSLPAQETSPVLLTLRTATWQPRETIPGSDDVRTLGVRGRVVTVKAEGSSDSCFEYETENEN
ncbi:MAG: glycosyl hydrolase family 28-related protein [Planctomycetia bacterium]|nr:glycosyl hydrolase family 28-related protein [Planctomycetia bacterium]